MAVDSDIVDYPHDDVLPLADTACDPKVRLGYENTYSALDLMYPTSAF